MSDRMWFQRVIGARDGFAGFWMCPTPNCSGAGFTMDIFPTDPSHPANEGWTDCDDEEFDDPDDEFAGLIGCETAPGEYDPSEPEYRAMDDALGDEADDIIEGDEWKLGVREPGEFATRPDWLEQMRREEEEEERRYNEPDERPRTLDWSDRESDISDDDVPF